MALDLFGNKTLQAIADLQAAVAKQETLLQLLLQKVNTIMANQDELDAVTARIAADTDRLVAAAPVAQAALDALRAQVADLEAQVAAGSPADFSAVHVALDNLDAAVAQVEGVA